MRGRAVHDGARRLVGVVEDRAGRGQCFHQRIQLVDPFSITLLTQDPARGDRNAWIACQAMSPAWLQTTIFSWAQKSAEAEKQL